MSEPQTAADIVRGYKEARARMLAAGLAHERRIAAAEHRLAAARQRPVEAPKPPELTPVLIIEAAAEVMGISVPYMLDYTSHNPPFIARALAAHFMRDRLDMTYLRIGEFLGGRNKETIKYAVIKIHRNIGHYRAWMEAIAKRLP